MPTFDGVWAVVHPALSEIQNDFDASWDAQREALLVVTEQVEEPARRALAELVQRLDDLPEGERAAILGSDRLLDEASALLGEYVAQAAVEEPAASDQGYDESAWNDYLQQNGPAWDGADASWPGFQEWFLYYARERGVGEPAEGLLAYLDGLPADQRVAVLAQYGVLIQDQSPPEAPAPGPASTAVPGSPPAPAATATEPEPAELTGEQEALAIQIAAIPGIEQLSEEELAKILADLVDAASGSER